MIEARMHIPTPPSELRWHHLMALAEILATLNTEYFLEQWQRYYELKDRGIDAAEPPCCITCVKPGIVYAPPPPGDQQLCQNWWPAPAVLARKKATCLGAAAFDVGAHRAEQYAKYGKQINTQATLVDLEPQGTPIDPSDPYSVLDFHAVAYIDGKRVDSTQKLIQKKGCGCG